MYGTIHAFPVAPRVGAQVINIKSSRNITTYIIGVIEDISNTTCKVRVVHTNDKDLILHNTPTVFIESDGYSIKGLFIVCEKQKLALKYSQWNAAIIADQVDTNVSIKWETKSVSGNEFAKVIPEKREVFKLVDLEEAFNAARQKIKQTLLTKRDKYISFKDYKDTL